MWQTKLSFAVGFLLSAGSAIAVADTAIQAGKAPSPGALSVTEFVKQAENAASTRTSDAPVKGNGERRVVSFSLVKFVEQAAAEGGADAVPRVSLVDLVAKASEPEATKPEAIESAAEQAPASISTETARNTESIAAHTPEQAPEPAGSPSGVLRTPSPRVGPPTTEPDSTLFAERQYVAGDAVETSVPATVSVPPEPLPLVVTRPIINTDTGSAAPVSQALLSDLASVVPPLTESFSVEPSELSELDGKSSKLQLFDAVRSALNGHPAIAESLSRLDGQQEQVSIARAGYWPQLRSGINTGYRHTTGRSEEALTVSASQRLYDFGKVSSAVEAAESGVDREEAGVLLAAEDLIRDTAQAFIEARRFEELVDLATQQIDAIAELEALATKRSAMGAASLSDQMQAKSRREAARATQLQMQAQRDQWHRALENLIGSRQAVALDAAYPEPLEGLCPRLPENFDSAPRVVIAEAERAEAEAAIRSARAERRPTLSLNADFEHYLNRDTGGGLQQLDDQEFVVSLNLSTNLFQGGALRARSRAAEHALYSANAARDRALLELSRLYRETRDRARSLTTSLALQDDRYDSIVKTQELYRHQYLSLGTRTLLDILNTEQEIFQTQVDKQNTLFDLRSLQIDCLYSVGGLRKAFRAGEALDHRVSSRITEVRS
ncbi:TolC family outer membrane protein [Pseudomonas sp. FME51]|uniref:TolC family outer membrane protein n=1 Tax=Pseudomonas sp. FME51 TaxID=2742609 RepID=UPI0018671630|nr:TolC family outer membrane protein [Pseudomonas sp. FME51]